MTPLNLPKGETSGLHLKELQHVTPLLWKGRGGSKEGLNNYDNILFLLFICIKKRK